MKTILVSFVLMIALTLSAFAQTTTTNGSAKRLSGSNLFVWDVTLDSLETEYSQPFTFAGFEPETLNVYFSADINALTGGKGYATLISVLASYDGTNWIVAEDTLANLTSASITNGSNSLGSIKAPYYKLKAVNSKGSNVLKTGVYIVP